MSFRFRLDSSPAPGELPLTRQIERYLSSAPSTDDDSESTPLSSDGEEESDVVVMSESDTESESESESQPSIKNMARSLRKSSIQPPPTATTTSDFASALRDRLRGSAIEAEPLMGGASSLPLEKTSSSMALINSSMRPSLAATKGSMSFSRRSPPAASLAGVGAFPPLLGRTSSSIIPRQSSVSTMPLARKSSCAPCAANQQMAKSSIFPSRLMSGDLEESEGDNGLRQLLANGMGSADVTKITRVIQAPESGRVPAKDLACWERPGQVTWTVHPEDQRPDLHWPAEYWRDLPQCPDELDYMNAANPSRGKVDYQLALWESFSGEFACDGLDSLPARLEPFGLLHVLRGLRWPGCLVLALPLFASAEKGHIDSCGWVLHRCMCFFGRQVVLNGVDVLNAVRLFYQQPFTRFELEQILHSAQIQGLELNERQELIERALATSKNSHALERQLETGNLLRYQTLQNCCFTGFRVLYGPDGEYVLQLRIKPFPPGSRERFCLCQEIPSHRGCGMSL